MEYEDFIQIQPYLLALVDIKNTVSVIVVRINDFTDHIVTRKDRSHLVIGVRDNISRVHVDEHDLIMMV